jgi:hypothetical protein
MDPPAIVQVAVAIVPGVVCVTQTNLICTLVSVSPDTNPLVRPHRARGFTGRTTGFTEDGDYLIRNTLSQSGERAMAIASKLR